MTKSSDGEKYVELMTPAFLGGMEARGCSTESGRRAIHFALGEVDWANSGLPLKEFGNDPDEIGEQDMKPEQYSHTLADFAFLDAATVIELCRDISSEKLPKGITLRQLLKNSKKSLLTVALIPDEEKTNIYKAIQLPEVSYLYAPDISTDDPIVVSQLDNGEYVLDWNDSIKTRIRRLREESPERGCPAYRKIVEVDGRKQPLIYAFWDALLQETHE